MSRLLDEDCLFGFLWHLRKALIDLRCEDSHSLRYMYFYKVWGLIEGAECLGAISRVEASRLWDLAHSAGGRYAYKVSFG